MKVFFFVEVHCIIFFCAWLFVNYVKGRNYIIIMRMMCETFFCLNAWLLWMSIKQIALSYPFECTYCVNSLKSETFINSSYLYLSFRSHERTPEELELVFEELLHIPALSHLSTSIKRELASIIVFESHAQAGTVCE